MSNATDQSTSESLPVNKMRPIHPGEILREEFMVDPRISVAALAKKLNIHQSDLQRFVDEQASMSELLAEKLSVYFGNTSTLWLNLQESYDERIASDVDKRVKKIVSDILGIDEDEITDSSNLVNDLHADSLDFVDIVMEVELEFNVEIPDEDASRATTYGQLVSCLKNYLKG